MAGKDKFQILTALLFIVGVAIPAFAQEGNNVQAGFFSEDTVVSGVFGNTKIDSNQQGQEENAAKIDSWTADAEDKYKNQPEYDTSYSAEEETVAKPKEDEEAVTPSYSEFQGVVEQKYGKNDSNIPLKPAKKKFRQRAKSPIAFDYSKRKRRRRHARAFDSFDVDLNDEQSNPETERLFEEAKLYQNAPVVSLLVNANNHKSLTKSLEQLRKLHKNQKVAIGQVFLVDQKKQLQQPISSVIPTRKKPTRQLAKMAQVLSTMAGAGSAKAGLPIIFQGSSNHRVTRLIKEMGFKSPSQENADEIIARLGVKYSPVWIVRYDGKDYVYEGNYNPSRLFTRDGKFLDGESND